MVLVCYLSEGETMSQRLIRLPEVRALVGLGTTSIYDKIKKGEFPKQVKLGRLSGWVEAEVQEWISRQIGARRPSLAPTSHQAAFSWTR
jgi:prophage regulatory protein